MVLDYIVAGAREVDGWVVGFGGFFDGIAALGLDGNSAFVFLFSDFAAQGRAVPVPRGCWAKMLTERVVVEEQAYQ